MRTNVTLPETFSVHVACVKQTFDIHTADVPEDMLGAIMLYGWRECLGNAGTMGGKDKSDAERLNQVRERLAAIMDGTWAGTGGRGALDDMTVEIRKIVVDKLVALRVPLTEARQRATKDHHKAFADFIDMALRAKGATVVGPQLTALREREWKKVLDAATAAIAAREEALGDIQIDL